MNLKEFENKYYVVAKLVKEYRIGKHNDSKELIFTSLSPFVAIEHFEVKSRLNNSLVYTANTNDEQEALIKITKHFKLE